MKSVQLERLTNFAASVITLASFAYSLRQIGALFGSSTVTLGPPALPFRAFPLRLIAISLVQGATAYGFATLTHRIAALGPGFGRVLLFVAWLIAGWTSLFNAQWLLLGPLPAREGLSGIWIASRAWLPFAGVAAILVLVQWYFVTVKFGEPPNPGAWLPDYSKPKPVPQQHQFPYRFQYNQQPIQYELRWDPWANRASFMAFNRNRDACQGIFVAAFIIVVVLVVHTWLTS